MKEFKNCRNPVLPTYLHIPDSEAHIMPDGRVYVYGSWDQYDEDVYCSKEYRVFSSSNMIDWTDHGKSFDSSQVQWMYDENAHKYPVVDWDNTNPTPMLKKTFEDTMEAFTTKDLLYAPDAISKNGKYYLYFCLSDITEGVAVSDRPEGPFSNPVQLPCAGIDPAVFIDDDGQAYYFWGQFRSSGAKLKDNMIEFEENSITNKILTEEEHGFHEGSSVRKRNGIYYCVYASIIRGKATSLAYATSKSPLGPYEYKGIIIDNDGCDPQSWNNHGSIEEVNGQWYVFYHRSSQNKKIRRRLCIEPIFFNEDGTIQEVLMTSQGAGRPFSIDEQIEAYRACYLSGSVYIAPLKNDCEGLTGIRDGDTAIYRYVEWERPTNGVYINATGSGEIIIYLDEEEDPSGSVTVSEGCITSSVFKAYLGKHTIKLKFNKVNNLEVYSLKFDINEMI
ncbi:xylosidase [Clostridium beijerinckii]|uniref:Xylosidase n=1 Tax=Clostridium beijerinckii TaxID=1520 RepID=A0A0B5QJ59_CLOBE|nr:family 43 glycosylhydrolase [Clostridium beijerinckii]AJG98226.1 xylosidase [Clostridium beijerinckii]